MWSLVSKTCLVLLYRKPSYCLLRYAGQLRSVVQPTSKPGSFRTLSQTSIHNRRTKTNTHIMYKTSQIECVYTTKCHTHATYRITCTILKHGFVVCVISTGYALEWKAMECDLNAFKQLVHEIPFISTNCTDDERPKNSSHFVLLALQSPIFMVMVRHADPMWVGGLGEISGCLISIHFQKETAVDLDMLKF